MFERSGRKLILIFNFAKFKTNGNKLRYAVYKAQLQKEMFKYFLKYNQNSSKTFITFGIQTNEI